MAEGHWKMHRRLDTTSIPSVITGPAGLPTPTGTGIASATAPLTFVTETVSLSSGGFSTITRPVTNSDELASLTSAQAASTSNAPSSTSSNAAATSSQSTKSPSIPSSTLIPAIVAPIVAVLIISFVAFWWFMRRRTQKALEREPEFVMEGMKEKPRSRPVTADSDSSTQKLVPNKVKEATIDVKEVDRPSQDTFRPPVGVGADDAGPRTDSAMSSRPGSRQASQDASGKSKAIPNFSRGPRPGTAGRDSTASPAPSVAQRDREGDRSGPRPPPSVVGNPRPTNGPPTAGRNNPSGPMPPSVRARGPPPGPKGPPAAIITRPDASNKNLMSPSNIVSAGAYNGASPISQYSPIVKEMPKFGTAPTATKKSGETRAGTGSDLASASGRKGPPSAIKTASSPITSSDTGFSEENMRIARLANNSRLGFSTATSPTVATEEPPTPSPRLPPPATRDAPPTNYNIPLPAHEPPAPASIQSRLNGVSVSDRRSVVSGLSDDYVDMEVDDNKSDVSSLDEREKWQMETEREDSHQGGLAVYGGSSGLPRPPLLSSPNPESGFSETSGSQYSLGKY